MNIVSWKGREGRLQSFIGDFVGLTALVLLFILLNRLDFMTDAIRGLIASIYLFLYFYLNLCSKVRRLHDMDRPGRDIIYKFIPFYNIYFEFLLIFQKGTKGDNIYGKDPLEGSVKCPECEAEYIRSPGNYKCTTCNAYFIVKGRFFSCSAVKMSDSLRRQYENNQ